MHTALMLLAQGRGEDLDDGGGIIVIIAVIAAIALTMLLVATLVIRRARRPDERTGPPRETHDPGHGGRVSSMERDQVER